MAAEQRPSSEATARLPEVTDGATVQAAAASLGAAPSSEVVPPPLPHQPDASRGLLGKPQPPLLPHEKAQRRLIKNLVMGGFFVAVLVALFYFLSR